MQDVSKILTRKYYGKKDPFRSREFRQPRWMELLAVLLFTVSGLGEGKSINVVLGGLPKATARYCRGCRAPGRHRTPG